MNSKESNLKGERSLWNFKIDRNSKLKPGDVVKILNWDGDALEFGYITEEIKEKNGIPIVAITLQKGLIKINMVVTDAIQKV